MRACQSKGKEGLIYIKNKRKNMYLGHEVATVPIYSQPIF